jgi:hypothetical protein
MNSSSAGCFCPADEFFFMDFRMENRGKVQGLGSETLQRGGSFPTPSSVEVGGIHGSWFKVQVERTRHPDVFYREYRAQGVHHTTHSPNRQLHQLKNDIRFAIYDV